MLLEDDFDGVDIRKFVQDYLTPLIEKAELEENYKKVYLNKYDVVRMIQALADESEPMVSAPTYNYYEINAGEALDSLDKLEEYRIESGKQRRWKND